VTLLVESKELWAYLPASSVTLAAIGVNCGLHHSPILCLIGPIFCLTGTVTETGRSMASTPPIMVTVSNGVKPGRVGKK
jgi:hypothetical protein